MSIPSHIIESINSSIKSCPFHIGQRVHMRSESYEMEVIGIRKNPQSGYFEVEVMLADIEMNRTWHLLPNILSPVYENKRGHLCAIDGGRK